jgi:DNA-binding MarR family transcriptional regulator
MKRKVGTPIERASRWMFARIITGVARALRDEDLSIAQLAAIHLVDQAGELGQSQLADALALSPSAASRLVDGLVQRNLLERREAAHDRRVRVLTVGAHGAELLDAFGDERTRLIERLTSKLPTAIVKVFLDNVERHRAAEGGKR